MSIGSAGTRTGQAAPLLAVAAKDFIVGPFFDSFYFILSPVLALVLGMFVSGSRISQRSLMLGSYENTVANMLIGTFIMAHLFIVFFRSHGNPKIFHTHRIRFTVVPIALLLAMCLSSWVAVSVSVLATWWDVYHSSLQSFGIGRIYDARKGNQPSLGRRLDQILNTLLYAGPILAGASLMDHVNDFHEFEEVGSVFFTSIPAYVESQRALLTWGVLGLGVPFLVFYVLSYCRFHRQGYQISFPKVALLVSTGIVSIYTWGFNTFGEAFFIMNFFHALQYFALVWVVEKKNITQKLRVTRYRWGKWLALALFLGIGFSYGFWAETLTDSDLFFNVVIVISIMHFWYDGFIWSVRKKQV